MSENNQATNSGGGVFGLLGVAFVVMKLCHVIDWSWWWVTLPFWGGAALVIVLFLCVLVIAVIKAAAEK